LERINQLKLEKNSTTELIFFTSVSLHKKQTEISAKLPTDIDLFFKEVRNAAKAHIALIRDSPYVPRTLQMQLMRINRRIFVGSLKSRIDFFAGLILYLYLGKIKN
jgi:hypothetical protein